jgi:flagellar hook assembly protein FlgD
LSFAWGVVALDRRGLTVLRAAPNPMTGQGRIYFFTDYGSAQVTVRVFDVAGRLIRDFGQFHVGPGKHHLHWDGCGGSGAPVPDGLYFVRVISDRGDHLTTKLVVAH